MFELVDQYLRLCGHVRDSLSACVRACIVLGYQFIGHPHFRVRAGGVTGEVPGAAGVRYAAWRGGQPLSICSHPLRRLGSPSAHT